MEVAAQQRKDGAALARWLRRQHRGGEAKTVGMEPYLAAYVSSSSFSAFQSEGVDPLLLLYKEEEGAWLAPVVALYLAKLRSLARAEIPLLQHTKTLLDSVFRFITITARQQSGRETGRDGMLFLFLVVQQMRVFVRLKQDVMVSALVSRVVDQANFPPLELASLATRVTYAYFWGRNLVLENNAAGALEPLEFCLRNLPARAKAQRDLVHAYLWPAQLALGRAPRNAECLDECHRAIARHMANGNVDALTKELESRWVELSRRGTFTMLWRARVFAHRNLLKHCLAYHRSMITAANAGDGNKLPLALFRTALSRYNAADLSRAAAGDGADAEDYVFGIVANLIQLGLVKGYISYERFVLVVSAKDALPKTVLIKN